MENISGDKHFIASISESRYYVKLILETQINGYVVRWLLLEDLNMDHYSLINLHSMENIQLPQPTLMVRSYILLMYPPVNTSWEACNDEEVSSFTGAI